VGRSRPERRDILLLPLVNRRRVADTGEHRLTAAGRSGSFPALEKLHQNHDDGHHEQDMDESAHGIGRNKSQQPGDDQDESDGVKHGQVLSARLHWDLIPPPATIENP
jgi:hypothetical protein